MSRQWFIDIEDPVQLLLTCPSHDAGLLSKLNLNAINQYSSLCDRNVKHQGLGRLVIAGELYLRESKRDDTYLQIS